MAKEGAEVRTTILAKMEQNQEVTLQKVSGKCEIILKLQYDTGETERIDCF